MFSITPPIALNEGASAFLILSRIDNTLKIKFLNEGITLETDRVLEFNRKKRVRFYYFIKENKEGICVDTNHPHLSEMNNKFEWVSYDVYINYTRIYLSEKTIFIIY